nr:putative ribonuclease H-like domain-containing protein [Tanacetum cinerariifolium]
DVSSLRYIVLPNWVHKEHLESISSQPQEPCNTDAPESSGNSNPTTTSTNPSGYQVETLTVETTIPTVSPLVPTVCFTDSRKPSSKIRLISKRVTNQAETPSLDNILTLTNQFEDTLRGTTNSEESNGVEADVSNMEASITASPTPTLRIYKDHPKSQIIGPGDTLIQTRNKSKEVGEQSFIAIIHQKTDPSLLQFCLFSCFLSQVEPKKIYDALQDPSWVEAKQEELLQFKIQNVWTLVDCPKGVRPIGTKWVLKNKKDERGIVIRNKARLVAQGHTQEEGIDYDEVFAPVARIEAIRLFLAYASFMNFVVYQIDVKSAFLYGTIDEEVGTIDQTLFIKKQREDFILVQVYVDDIIFGLSNPQLCREFEALMHEKIQISSMGELNFFLGLQVLQKEDGIFLSQDKYVGDILKKFRYTDVKSSNTLMDKENPWGKEGTGKDIDLHLYRSMIRSLMYLTASRPDIMVVPPGFYDPQFPDKVYKVEKAMYGLHQAPRAWYGTLSKYLLTHSFQRGTIDQTLFIRKHRGDFLLVQVYVDDIIFGSLNLQLCREFEALMTSTWVISPKSLDIQKSDIMFAVCAYARHQVTPNECHLHAVKIIFRYLRGHPKLGIWYPKESPFDLVAYSDSDYGGATQDRKSTTRGCKFLGRRLISWKCKKQTIVATSTTEAEFVAAASGCRQVLWIQNQLLDYGHHFIRDCFEKKPISVDHIHTDDNVADLLTKPFDAGRFQYLVDSVVNMCIVGNKMHKAFPLLVRKLPLQEGTSYCLKKNATARRKLLPLPEVCTAIIVKEKPAWRETLILGEFPSIHISRSLFNSQKEMDHQYPTVAKIPVLDTRKFKQWQFWIQQYLQHEHYALWEVIEFDDSYKVPTNTDLNNTSTRKYDEQSGRTVTITTEDMQWKKNNVKARTTLLLSLPDEHQLRFSKYKTTKELWAAIIKTFSGNEATKKRKKNLLKQQYGNFKADGLKKLEKTFNRLQVIVSQLQFMDVEVEKDDLNHNGDEDGNTACVSTSSTTFPTASASVATISQDTASAYIASQSNGSQIKFEDINQIDEDDMEEIDIKWSMALLSMRANKFWKRTGKNISIQGLDVAGFDKSNVECFNCYKMGYFIRECRAPRSQERERKENYRQGSKAEEKTQKALMDIDGVGWDWSYMANEGEDHALVANTEAPIEFALMANTKSKVFDNSLCSNDCKKNNDSLNSKIKDLTGELFKANNYIYHYKLAVAQLEGRLVEYKEREVKYNEKIRTLEMYRESNLKCIKTLDKELETLKLEKDGLDGKLAGLLKASKNLDNLIESQRYDKVKDGVGYNAVPPAAADLYFSPKKDLSWTGLPEFVDDIVTDYSRPSLTVASTSAEGQNKNSTTSEDVASPNTPKPFVKFVKPKDSQSESKTNKQQTPKKPQVKYAKQYRHSNKKPNLKGNQRNWNNLKSYQLGPEFVLKKEACFNCGDFSHFANECRKRVQRKTTRSISHRPHGAPMRPSHRPAGHRPHGPSMNPMRPNMNGARPNRSFFIQAHSYETRPFLKSSAVKTQYRAPWVPTVNRNNPPVNKKFSTCRRNFPTINRKFPTASRKFTTGSTKIHTADMGRKGKAGSSQNNIDDKGYWDSGCSRHMTSNISYLSDFEPFDRGYVSFGQGGCKITSKGTIKNGHLNVKTMNKLVRHNLVRGLPTKSFDNDHTCTACLKGKQHKVSCKSKLVNSMTKPLHTLHMDLFGLTFVSSISHKWYCLVGTDDFSRFTWTFFLMSKDETSDILKKFITEIENLKDLKVKIIRCDNRGEFRNKEMNDFCSQKGIKREFSNARTLHQNGVAERRNRTFIEAARTMLADAKLPVTFWAEAVNTACYVQNRVLVNKSQNKTPYELFNGRTPAIDFLNHLAVIPEVPKGSGNTNHTASTSNPPAAQIETLTVEIPIPTVSSPGPTACLNDSLDPSSDARLISKRVANQEETLSLDNILSLTNRFEDILGVTTSSDEAIGVEADVSNMETSISASPTPTLRIHKDHPKSQIIGPVDTPIQTRHKSKEVEEQSCIASIYHKTDPALLQFCLFSCFLSQVEPKKVSDSLQDPSWVLKNKKDERGIVVRNKARLVAQGHIQEEGIDYDEVFAPVARIEAIRLFLAYASFMGFTVYQMDVKSAFLYGTIDEEVYAPRAWHQVTPKECHLHEVKRIFRYLKGHPKLGLWYPKASPFDLVAYSDSDYGGASQDSKSTTGGTIGVEDDVSNMETTISASLTPTLRIHKDHPKSQIIGPVDTPIQTRHKSKENVWTLVDCPKGVRPIRTKWVLKNKKDERGIVVRNKARLVAQGHTQEEGIDYDKLFAPVAKIEAIRLFLAYASFMGFTVYQMDVKSVFLYGTIDEEVYMMQPPGFQDPAFPTKVYKVEKAMYGLHQAPRACPYARKFQMSAMGELNFFIGLQVLQKEDGIFLSQDKYIGDILKKFGYSDVRSSNTPMDKENPWGKDGTGKYVDLHLYRSMIGSLMYLTTSRPDIMFAVCACTRHQVTPKECHLHAVKRIFRYLNWGVDHKSTTGGSQFLGRRLISWQCKKQTIVATSTTEAEYVAAASYCRQSSALPTVADEPASRVRDVSEGEACHTESGFIAYQDRATIAKSSTLPHVKHQRLLPLLLMREAQEEEIVRLKERVQVLEDREGDTAKQSGDDAPIKGRSIN